MNLVLTGFMGTGKTTVGREVARRLGRAFVDMDDVIVARAGKPIPRIFAEDGEAAFRAIEAAVCAELGAQDGLVIATGGGALVDANNRRVMLYGVEGARSETGPGRPYHVVICLDADPEEILRRVGGNDDRPLLNVDDPRAEVARLLAARREAYAAIPWHVATSGRSVDDVVTQALALAETITLPVRYPAGGDSGGEYPIYIGRGLLAHLGGALRAAGVREGTAVAIVTNPVVAAAGAVGDRPEQWENVGGRGAVGDRPERRECAGGARSETGPSNRGSETGSSSRESETGLSNRRSETGSSSRESETGPSNRGSETGPSNRGSETGPSNRGSETGPSSKEDRLEQGGYAGRVEGTLREAGYRPFVCTIPDGEQHKTLDTVRALYDHFLVGQLDRSGVVLALGGGVTGDIAGFAAATFMRGTRFVQVPTSLLAITDASVGGKTGVDLPQGKNLVGAFKQPELVLIDVDVLDTLPEAEFRSGMAELLKHGVIGAAELFEKKQEARGKRQGVRGKGQDTSALHPASGILHPASLARSLQVKIDIVEEDPFERGRRAVLNLGHTTAHGLEQVSDFTLRHGDAVSIGMVVAARIAEALGRAEPGLAARIADVLAAWGLPVTCPPYPVDAIWQAMTHDKKKQGKGLRWILPRALGDVVIADDVPESLVRRILVEMGAEK